MVRQTCRCEAKLRWTVTDRLCATTVLDAMAQAVLKAQRAAINPRQLCTDIYALRDKVFDLPPASHASDGWLIR